jgi:hypothetical protein
MASAGFTPRHETVHLPVTWAPVTGPQRSKKNLSPERGVNATVCRIVALPTQSQVIVAGATAPHGPSAPGARLIEMSPRRSSGLLAMDAKSDHATAPPPFALPPEPVLEITRRFRLGARLVNAAGKTAAQISSAEVNLVSTGGEARNEARLVLPSPARQAR